VDAGTVDGQVLLRGHAGMDLGTAGVEALDVDFVAGCDVEARWEGAIPDGVDGVGGEGVGAHPAILTVIWISTRALRGRALTPMAARTWRPDSPKMWMSRSEAPLMTAGESANPGAALT